MEQINIQTILQKSTGFLTRKGAENPRLLSEVLLAHVLAKDRVYLFSHFDEPLNTEEVSRFRKLLERAAKKEPAAYIIGHKEFMSLDFIVSPKVLIPRPDTEIMVEEALRLINIHGYKTVVDIGTGSGCIPISIAKYVQGSLDIKAVDISNEALKIAQQNADLNEVSVSFIKGNLTEPLNKEGIQADLITANLPYVSLATYEKLDANVREYEPRIALTDEADGLKYYRMLMKDLSSVLKPTGRLLMEIDPRQREKLGFIVDAGYKYHILNDLAGRPRVVVVSLQNLSEEEPMPKGTIILRVNPEKPEEEILKIAATAIAKGELVAFPTETVYGLAAAYNNPHSLDEIFKVKKRPQDSPLLVAIGDVSQLKLLTEDISDAAQKLMEVFWPGPLSIVFKGIRDLPSQVKNETGGIGVRMPSDKTARTFIRLSGPISAPSANCHGRPSPLTAEHVKMDLDGEIPYIIDAGMTKGGVESTIVDCTVQPPRLLRQGAISREELEAVLGQEIICENKIEKSYKLNYSVFTCPTKENFDKKRSLLCHFNRPYGILSFNENIYDNTALFSVNLKPENSTTEFFQYLRDAEKAGVKTLLIGPFMQVSANYPEGLRQRIFRLMKTRKDE